MNENLLDKVKEAQLAYDIKRMKIIMLDDAYRIDTAYYNAKGKNVKVVTGEIIKYGLFGSKKEIPARTFKALVLSFIDNVNNLEFGSNILSGDENTKKVSLLLPEGLIDDEYVLKAIENKTKGINKKKTETKSSSDITFSQVSDEFVQLIIVDDNGASKTEELKVENGMVRNLIIPTIEKMWGKGEILELSIVYSKLSEINNELYYEIKVKKGDVIRVKINKYYFDIYGIAAIEKFLRNGKVDHIKIGGMLKNIKEKEK